MKIEIRNYKITKNYEYKLGEIKPIVWKGAYAWNNDCNKPTFPYSVDKDKFNVIWSGELDISCPIVGDELHLHEKDITIKVDKIVRSTDGTCICFTELIHDDYIEHNITDELKRKLELFNIHNSVFKDPIITDIVIDLSKVNLRNVAITLEFYNKMKEHNIIVDDGFKAKVDVVNKLKDIPEFLFKHTEKIDTLFKITNSIYCNEDGCIKMLLPEYAVKDAEQRYGVSLLRTPNEKSFLSNCTRLYWYDSFERKYLYDKVENTKKWWKFWK